MRYSSSGASGGWYTSACGRLCSTWHILVCLIARGGPSGDRGCLGVVFNSGSIQMFRWCGGARAWDSGPGPAWCPPCQGQTKSNRLVVDNAHVGNVDGPGSLVENFCSVPLFEPTLHCPVPCNAQADVQKTARSVDVARVAPGAWHHQLAHRIGEGAVHETFLAQVGAVVPQEAHGVLSVKCGLQLRRQFFQPAVVAAQEGIHKAICPRRSRRAGCIHRGHRLALWRPGSSVASFLVLEAQLELLRLQALACPSLRAKRRCHGGKGWVTFNSVFLKLVYWSSRKSMSKPEGRPGEPGTLKQLEGCT
jgi:hypothetical protein